MLETFSKSKPSIPSCSICKHQYDSYYRIPRVIPKCGHTFCEKCINISIQVKANRKIFVCIDCHSQTVIRKGAAQDIPKNIGVLDIVKNMKKIQFQEMSPSHNKSPVRDSPAKVKQYCKDHPNKELDLVCETCSFEKVCSICALIGNSHQDHKFVEYVPASKFDLNQVKQVFTIIDDTVKQTILPDASENIIKRNQQNLIKMLVSSVKDYFRQNYYKLIEKKQNEVIAQVREIKFDGGVSRKIEEIAKHYDLLKVQYLDMFSLKGNSKENTSLEVVQDFIQKCKDLHNEIEKFSEHAEMRSKEFLKDISIKISQSSYFRIQQIPFSLKQLLMQKQQVMTSPTKSKPSSITNIQQVKNKQVEFSSKLSSRGQKSNINSEQQLKSVQNISFEIERKPFTANSINTKKQSYMPPKQKIAKNDARTEKADDSLIPMLDFESKINEKKSPATKTKLSSNTERLNKSSFQTLKQQKRSVQKQKGSHLNLSRMQATSEYNSPNSDLPLRLKEVKPTKQLPLALKPKYSAITKQITRQSTGQSLELISMQINDQLIVYVMDYIKTKKLKFSMIKLVKNNLTDEGLSILLGTLINDDCTQVLNLTSNQLTSRSLDLLMEFGQKNSFLKTVYLSHNKISSQTVKNKNSQFEQLGMNLIL